MSVDMGQAKVVGPEPEWVEGDVLEATRVDVGNPHLVLRWGGAELPDRDELVAIGSRIDGATPGGANVEIVRAQRRARRARHGGVRARRRSHPRVRHRRLRGRPRPATSGSCADPPPSSTCPADRPRSRLGDPTVLTGDVTSVAILDTPWPCRR